MEEEKKGYKVEDKRKAFRKDSVSEQTEKKAKKAQTDSVPLPPINFSTFIISLSSSALVHLGEIPEPSTGKYQKNLQLAKQTIDILEMLKEKTTGNLDSEEESLLTNVLFDLRVKYVKAKG
ncbi:MAG: DUF1844 domain-containing protein [Candidatus Desulfofervidaceae bacterium]|nr:DUF1844 domain-containing protein [Candidatus Desulfofervidaceae bacterium]